MKEIKHCSDKTARAHNNKLRREYIVRKLINRSKISFANRLK